jgi:transcriptional regulator of acetoin/glycerol metabolism
VLWERNEEVTRSNGCVTLTDKDGLILRQWAGNDALLSRLQDANVMPGFFASEGAIGTTSAITLVSRKPEIVRGPEHFSDQFADITSSGVVITHPVSKAVVGSLHLTNDFANTTPLALNWIEELARTIQQSLLASATLPEQSMLERFLMESRSSNLAVISIGERTILMNKPASRIIGPLDQAVLWEHAARAGQSDTPTSATMRTDDGRAVALSCSRVREGNVILGVTMKLAARPLQKIAKTPLEVMPAGLVGESSSLHSALSNLVDLRDSSLLILGEPGTGKLTVARALCEGSPTLEVDAREFRGDAVFSWLSGAGLEGNCRSLVIRRLELLPTEQIPELLHCCDAGIRLIATTTALPRTAVAVDAALQRGPRMMTMPPLRERWEDLPDLVAKMTSEILHSRDDQRRSVSWMSDAIQPLTRMEWPENLTSLEKFVGNVLSQVRTQFVTLRDLPSDAVLSGRGRRLAGLERVEANAILQSLRDCDGNKLKASAYLGIARSTLYRKMRALNIDDGTPFVAG